MLQRHCFLKNNGARVSFAVLGIFLIIGSSATTVYIRMYDEQIFEKNTWDNQQELIERILATARLDLTQLINVIGINALQYISSHPITECSALYDSSEQANQYRLKQEISKVLTNYLYCNYADNHFQQGNLNLLVDISQLSSTISLLEQITITPISMKLNRPLTLPFFGPEQRQSLPIYYKIDCEIPIIITKSDNQNTSHELSMMLSVSTVLTTRFLLMNNLIESFEESINGFGPFWRTVTLLTNIYSMARGYRHYQTGKPINVVDNKHVELITNLVFLFEEALSFSGIDPELLIDTIKQSKIIFSNEQTSNLSIFNSASSNDWSVSFTDFQKISESSSLDVKTTQDYQLLNLSDIAASILWDYSTIKLYFTDEWENKKTIQYDMNDEKSLEETIQSYNEKGWMLSGTEKTNTKQNQTTLNQIQTICKSMYSGTCYTSVNRNGPTSIVLGNHSDYSIDNGSSPWIFHNSKKESQQDKPDKGLIRAGSIVFEEKYTVYWIRTHDYCRKNVEEIDNRTITTWKEQSTLDTKIEHNVTFSIILDAYGNMDDFPREIKDVCYHNLSLVDSNLNSIVPTYQSTVYNKQKDLLFTAENGNYLYEKIDEAVPSDLQSLVYHEFIDVFKELSCITSSKKFSTLNYPNPKTLISFSSKDLCQRFQSNKTQLLNEDDYLDNDQFRCTKQKALFAAKIWYLDIIGKQLNQYSTDLYNRVEEEISFGLHEAGISDSNTFDEAMNEDLMTSLKRQIKIPFSLPMKLSKQNTDYETSWNETVVFSIDHQPGYCSCFTMENIDGKDEYFLGIRNNCLLGSSGLPILPISPTTPWLITLNIWLVQIRGDFAQFSVSDTGDETVFHPLFCYEPLEFVRKNEVIRADDGTILGWNTRLSYAIDTISCAIVPSGGCMVGDTNGLLSEHHGKPIH